MKTHNNVGKIERYYIPLRRVFKVIRNDLRGSISDGDILQMAVKAVNDIAGPNSIILILLIFGAYLRMTKNSPILLSITIRAEAIRKAIKEIQRLHAQRAVRDGLAIRNNSNTSAILELPIQSDVKI